MKIYENNRAEILALLFFVYLLKIFMTGSRDFA